MYDSFRQAHLHAGMAGLLAKPVTRGVLCGLGSGSTSTNTCRNASVFLEIRLT